MYCPMTMAEETSFRVRKPIIWSCHKKAYCTVTQVWMLTLRKNLTSVSTLQFQLKHIQGDRSWWQRGRECMIRCLGHLSFSSAPGSRFLLKQTRGGSGCWHMWLRSSYPFGKHCTSFCLCCYRNYREWVSRWRSSLSLPLFLSFLYAFQINRR